MKDEAGASERCVSAWLDAMRRPHRYQQRGRRPPQRQPTHLRHRWQPACHDASRPGSRPERQSARDRKQLASPEPGRTEPGWQDPGSQGSAGQEPGWQDPAGREPQYRGRVSARHQRRDSKAREPECSGSAGQEPESQGSAEQGSDRHQRKGSAEPESGRRGQGSDRHQRKGSAEPESARRYQYADSHFPGQRSARGQGPRGSQRASCSA